MREVFPVTCRWGVPDYVHSLLCNYLLFLTGDQVPNIKAFLVPDCLLSPVQEHMLSCTGDNPLLLC